MQTTGFDYFARRGTAEHYRDWTENARCSDSDRAVLLDACAAFDAAHVHGFSDLISVDSIVEAARHPRKVVWETGTLMLSQLAQSNEVARVALSSMAIDIAASNRSRAMFYLSDNHPRSYCLELLLRGTKDRSLSVAHVASWSALKLDLHELADSISDRIKTVEKPVARLEMEMIVGLMRNGFLEYHNENGYNIVVSFPDRYPTQVIWPGRWLIPEGEVHKVGLAKVRELIEDSPMGGNFCREWQWPDCAKSGKDARCRAPSPHN